MQSYTSTFRTPDGISIHVYHWTPDGGEVRGIIQIAHGLAEHAARYERFAEACTARGFAVVANDHRGHGKSVRNEDDRGHFADYDGWTLAVEDVAQVASIARSAHPGVPLLLFGHSMGSSLAITALYTHPTLAQASVLSGPTGVVGPLRHAGYVAATLERLRQGKRGKSAVLDQMSFGDFNKPFEPARTKFEWLSRDPDEVDKYVADPLCGFMATNQHWRDHLLALGANGDVANLARIPRTLPLLVVAGDRDPVGADTKQIDVLLQRLSKAGLRDVTHRYWPDGRHELLNDIVRDEVTAFVLGWSEQALGLS
jgi:alpha-beta hydrolase superfamily lysophospholipase